MADEQALKLIDRVIELITAGWCQGAAARDQNGNYVNVNDPSAVCYCIAGAMHRARFDGRTSASAQAAWLVEGTIARCCNDKTGFVSYVSFNDAKDTTKEMVLDVLQCAKEKIEAPTTVTRWRFSVMN